MLDGISLIYVKLCVHPKQFIFFCLFIASPNGIIIQRNCETGFFVVQSTFISKQFRISTQIKLSIQCYMNKILLIEWIQNSLQLTFYVSECVRKLKLLNFSQKTTKSICKSGNYLAEIACFPTFYWQQKKKPLTENYNVTVWIIKKWKMSFSQLQ